MASSKKFGDVVREARQRAHLSLRDLGDRMRRPDGTSLSPQYLNDIEHGRRNPPDESVIRRMAAVLGLDEQVLLSLAGREPEEIREYLAAMPEEREVIGRLFRKARQHGFKDWKRIEQQIDTPEKKS